MENYDNVPGYLDLYLKFHLFETLVSSMVKRHRSVPTLSQVETISRRMVR